MVTLELVSNVLRVLRLKHLDYLGCERLRTVSKNELISAFCKRPFDWGDCQFTPCLTFAKGLRFFTLILTITLSQSLVLDFCFLC